MAGAAGAAGQDHWSALLAALCGDPNHDRGLNGDGVAFDRAMSQTPGSTAGLTLLKLPTHPSNNEIAMHTFRAAGPWRSDAAAADKVERLTTFVAQCVYGNPDDTKQIRSQVGQAFVSNRMTVPKFHSHADSFLDILCHSGAAKSHRGKDGKPHNPFTSVSWSRFACARLTCLPPAPR